MEYANNMLCRSCGYPDSCVVSTSHNDRKQQTERRRECLKCGARFTTHEKHRDTPYKTTPPIHVLPK